MFSVIRVEIFGLPDFFHQLSDDARVQDQIMKQEVVTCAEECGIVGVKGQRK